MKYLKFGVKVLSLLLVYILVSSGFDEVCTTLDLMVVMYVLSVLLMMFLKKHFFMMLMALEFMMLVVLLKMMSLYNEGDFELSLYYVYLVVVVCEAAMGLAVLISLSRFWGNEVVKI